MRAKMLANSSNLQLISPSMLGQSVSLAWLKLAALLQQGTSNCPSNEKPKVATTIMSAIFSVLCERRRIKLVRHGVKGQWPH